jgi:hypothetical protein
MKEYHVIPSKPKTASNLWKPTDKQLWGQISEARGLIAEGRWRPADRESLRANWEEMEKAFGIDGATPEGRQEILNSVANEITPEHYTGTRPPMRSKKPATLGKELLAFWWASTYCSGGFLYFKFCLAGADQGRRVYIHSIHPDRNEKNVNAN